MGREKLTAFYRDHFIFWLVTRLPTLTTLPASQTANLIIVTPLMWL